MNYSGPPILHWTAIIETDVAASNVACVVSAKTARTDSNISPCLEKLTLGKRNLPGSSCECIQDNPDRIFLNRLEVNSAIYGMFLKTKLLAENGCLEKPGLDMGQVQIVAERWQILASSSGWGWGRGRSLDVKSFL
jgi:hypothetical protein